ncbi:MAG: tRNA preQ1(34) S-adenosylmethionine ribosyltransferase-isomerase QueA [Alphaproteobacteria bacterium]
MEEYLKEFDFVLPEGQIALHPQNPRDTSRLLFINSSSNPKTHKFTDIIDKMQAGDVLVLNNSKVIKARLFATHNNRKLEVLINKPFKAPNQKNFYEALIKNSAKLKLGDILIFSPELKAKIIEKNIDGTIIIEFIFDANLELLDLINNIGQTPLPPYILKKRKLLETDEANYQSIFAKEYGSVASSTASLHFTKELIEKIEDKGIIITFITLHIGLGTFKPLIQENFTQNKLHSETYSISKEAVSIINKAKKEGGKIIAVGTSVLRCLESATEESGLIEPKNQKETSLFIQQGFKFKMVDRLITNFHLPKSSLFILVCAFLGDTEKMKRAYKFAIDNNFRFYSYGDACFIERNKGNV